jgi:beta-phosphoglucomutase family hydrolase
MGKRTDGPARTVEAFIFDTDGVVTRTAEVHAGAWKETFDSVLQDRAHALGHAYVPMSDADYLRFVDGKARFDGVAAFLESRDIELPFGAPDDAPEVESVCGVGNRKNERFLQLVREHGVQPFESTLALVRTLRADGLDTAVVSASENAAAILDAAGAAPLFDVRVDGTDAARLHLAGKPDPALFLEAARRLGVAPADAAVVEDSLAGVEAGRRGGFGLVVGVDRGGQAQELAAHGADIVVADLAALVVDADGRWSTRVVAGP